MPTFFACRLADDSWSGEAETYLAELAVEPTGRVLGVEHLRKVVSWARGRGVIVASDDFYGPLGERHVRIALNFIGRTSGKRGVAARLSLTLGKSA